MLDLHRPVPEADIGDKEFVGVCLHCCRGIKDERHRPGPQAGLPAASRDAIDTRQQDMVHVSLRQGPDVAKGCLYGVAEGRTTVSRPFSTIRGSVLGESATPHPQVRQVAMPERIKIEIGQGPGQTDPQFAVFDAAG